MGLLQKVIDRRKERERLDLNDPVIAAHFIIGVARRQISTYLVSFEQLYLSSRCAVLLDSLEPKERAKFFTEISPIRLMIYARHASNPHPAERPPQYIELSHGVRFVTFEREGWDCLMLSNDHPEKLEEMELCGYLRKRLNQKELVSAYVNYMFHTWDSSLILLCLTDLAMQISTDVGGRPGPRPWMPNSTSRAQFENGRRAERMGFNSKIDYRDKAMVLAVSTIFREFELSVTIESRPETISRPY
jgi:hypothetical protein